LTNWQQSICRPAHPTAFPFDKRPSPDRSRLHVRYGHLGARWVLWRRWTVVALVGLAGPSGQHTARWPSLSPAHRQFGSGWIGWVAGKSMSGRRARCAGPGRGGCGSSSPERNALATGAPCRLHRSIARTVSSGRRWNWSAVAARNTDATLRYAGWICEKTKPICATMPIRRQRSTAIHRCQDGEISVAKHRELVPAIGPDAPPYAMWRPRPGCR
jgi:hypothetical protein